MQATVATLMLAAVAGASRNATQPGKYSELQFQIKTSDGVVQRAFSNNERIGSYHETDGITNGKRNSQTYAAFPDPANPNKVKVIGYVALYFIRDRPVCCSTNLDVDQFTKAFEGTYLFTQVDDTWTKKNATTYEKVGEWVGEPCTRSERDLSVAVFDPKTGFPVSTYHLEYSSGGEPGMRPECTSSSTSVAFEQVSADPASIRSAASDAHDKVKKLCDNSFSETCYF